MARTPRGFDASRGSRRSREKSRQQRRIRRFVQRPPAGLRRTLWPGACFESAVDKETRGRQSCAPSPPLLTWMTRRSSCFSGTDRDRLSAACPGGLFASGRRSATGTRFSRNLTGSLEDCSGGDKSEQVQLIDGLSPTVPDNLVNKYADPGPFDCKNFQKSIRTNSKAFTMRQLLREIADTSKLATDGRVWHTSPKPIRPQLLTYAYTT